MSLTIKHLPSPDGRYLAAVCGTRIAVWEGLIEEPVFVVPGRKTANFDRVVWTPNGKILVAVTQCGEVQAWTIPGGTSTVRWSPMSDSEQIKTIACSPLGTYVAALTEGQSVLVWNVLNGQLVTQFGTSFSAEELVWSADECVLSTDIAPVCWWDGSTVRLFLLPDQIACLDTLAPPQTTTDDEDLLATLTALAQCEQVPEMVRLFVDRLLLPYAA